MAGTTEKIYESSLEEQRGRVVDLDPNGSKQVLDVVDRIYVKRGENGKPVAVTHTISRHMTGRRMDTGHRWFRWVSDERRIVRLTKNGRMLVTNFEARRTPFTTEIRRVGDIHAHTETWPQHLWQKHLEAIVDHLGQPRPFEDVYPLSEHFPELDTRADPAFRAGFENVADIKTLVERLYGTQAVRKSLVKAVAQTDLRHLYLSWCLRGRHVPVDWHVDFLRRHPRPRGCADHLDRPESLRARGLRAHLRHLDKSSVRRLMRAEEVPWQMVSDLNRMKPSGRVTQVRSWTDLHDRAAVADRVIRRHEINTRELKQQQAADRRARRHAKMLEDPTYVARLEAAERARALEEAELERKRLEKIGERARVYDSTAKALTGSTERGAEVVVARDPGTLLTWGEEMGQCIAAYSHALHDRSSLLVGFYDGQTLVANAEVKVSAGPERKMLSQLLGKRNTTLPQETLDDYLPHLARAGVDVTQAWVGRPRPAA